MLLLLLLLRPQVRGAHEHDTLARGMHGHVTHMQHVALDAVLLCHGATGFARLRCVVTHDCTHKERARIYQSTMYVVCMSTQCMGTTLPCCRHKCVLTAAGHGMLMPDTAWYSPSPAELVGNDSCVPLPIWCRKMTPLLI